MHQQLLSLIDVLSNTLKTKVDESEPLNGARATGWKVVRGAETHSCLTRPFTDASYTLDSQVIEFQNNDAAYTMNCSNQKFYKVLRNPTCTRGLWCSPCFECLHLLRVSLARTLGEQSTSALH